MNIMYGMQLPEHWVKIAKVFEALGNEHRQKILLLFEKDEVLTITDIVEVSILKRSTIVHHLKILEEAGVLISFKDGKFTKYKVNKDIVLDSCNKLTDYINNYL